MLYPVAPPRLVGQGFVDTLNKGQRHRPPRRGLLRLVQPARRRAVDALRLRHDRHGRPAAAALLAAAPDRARHPVLVFITITGTANHYVLDAAAGALVVAMGFIGVWALMAARGRLRRQPAPRPLG